MDLNDVLGGFDQINPGFDLRGDPQELRQAAFEAKQALDPNHIVWKTLRFMQATKLRDWHNADSVEDREKLHGEIRGLTGLETQLRQIIESNDAVQEDLRQQ